MPAAAKWPKNLAVGWSGRTEAKSAKPCLPTAAAGGGGFPEVATAAPDGTTTTTFREKRGRVLARPRPKRIVLPAFQH